jgi:hypothetical protein
MKTAFLVIAILISTPIFAQIDTVVVRADSMFESKLHRKLYDNRTNVKYHLDERGNIRDIAVFLATLEELETGHKMYGVRVDQRLNRSLFTDAPMSNAEYIDEDEIPKFIGYLKKIREGIMQTDHASQQYTEYRFYTRAGIMLECYTGVSRWRCLLHYEISKLAVDTYISNPERLNEFIQVMEGIRDEIAEKRKKK